MKRFIIDHIDPLGQGVYKENTDIYFIPKTLPGESGSFKTLNSSKGVHFGQLISVEEKSEFRIEPECPLFSECNGCSYLHTDFENEHNLKKNIYKRVIDYNFPSDKPIELISNGERFNYRNRVQLHYDTKQKRLGYKKRKSKFIINIDNCLIADIAIQKKLKSLQENANWIHLLPKKHKATGHLELFVKGDEVQLIWNKKYSDGGFTQVNTLVNQLLQNKISDIYHNKNHKILDLFGGRGNLVNPLATTKKLSIDIYPDGAPPGDFLHLDLFKESALSEFTEKHENDFNILFIDPPRSGFKDLEKWSKTLKPSEIFYVSCNPQTMGRDIRGIMQDYEVGNVFLIDFFPGTSHYEAAVRLTKRTK
jgi:23S rRNA (uracil1939-C5)-methyltransferase